MTQNDKRREEIINIMKNKLIYKSKGGIEEHYAIDYRDSLIPIYGIEKVKEMYKDTSIPIRDDGCLKKMIMVIERCLK